MHHYEKSECSVGIISCSPTHFVNFVNFFGLCQVQTFRKKPACISSITISTISVLLLAAVCVLDGKPGIQAPCASPWSKVWIASGIVGFLGILVNATILHWKGTFSRFLWNPLNLLWELWSVRVRHLTSQGDLPESGLCFCCLHSEFHLGSPLLRKVSLENVACCLMNILFSNFHRFLHGGESAILREWWECLNVSRLTWSHAKLRFTMDCGTPA